MPRPPPGLPDWRDSGAYRQLVRADKAGLAWEWLRRDPRYREEARAAIAQRSPRQPPRTEEAAARWGLHIFEDPRLDAPAARPMWRVDVHALVLRAWSERCGEPGEAFDLDRLHPHARLAESDDQQHLLLSNGWRSIRLDVAGHRLLAGPVRLHYRLSGIGAAAAPLAVLQHFLTLARSGRFPASPATNRALRQVALLRTHDARLAGASQREIAAVLLDAEARQARWRVRAPSLRSTAQRMVRSAASMTAGRWLALLR